MAVQLRAAAHLGIKWHQELIAVFSVHSAHTALLSVNRASTCVYGNFVLNRIPMHILVLLGNVVTNNSRYVTVMTAFCQHAKSVSAVGVHTLVMRLLLRVVRWYGQCLRQRSA
jgi:hypothetical protein